ncbi:MAG TPA: rhomboid family intramembrane serine protease [Longimicrobiaceae bacterium]|nr:rhomboid family intramembrane serine protease [Longimicrobiaceae bacterium]
MQTEAEGGGGVAPPGYGYYDGALVPCSREALVERVRLGRPTPLVWTPETAGLVRPWHVPYLFELLHQRVVAAARQRVRLPALACGGVVLALLAGGAPALGSMGAVVAALAGMWLLAALHGLSTARRLTPRAFEVAVEQRVAVRPASTPYTDALSVLLVGVGALQLFFFDVSVGVGELGRETVAAGQWWRVLTAALLHGGVVHFALNFMALRDLGRLVETFAARGFVPLVFLVAALGGSAASLALPPHGTSLGSSGGLLGMVGFLGILGWRRKDQLPPGFLKMIVIDIALIAGLGILGYAFIDNAAHAGGLVAGGLVGLAAIPSSARVPRWEPGRAVRLAGIASLGVLALAALFLVVVVLLVALS